MKLIVNTPEPKQPSLGDLSKGTYFRFKNDNHNADGIVGYEALYLMLTCSSYVNITTGDLDKVTELDKHLSVIKYELGNVNVVELKE